MSLYNDIVGHEKIIEQLKNSVKTDKVSHAYIFNGEDGSGKKMMARAFAQALLCERGADEGCGECPSCKKVASGNNGDLIWVTHEKATIGVDDVRDQLVGDIQIKPYSSRYKIYVVDEAEKLTVQAQNAVLKTIEEPPEYSVIIFLTNNDQVFLPTILSRCVTLNFRPVRDSLVEEYLCRKHGLTEYEAKMCAAYAQGRIGKAVLLADSQDFRNIRDDALNLVRNVYSYDIADLLDAVKKVSEYKISIYDYIDILQMWYRDVLLFKVTKDLNNLVFIDEANQIRKQASQSSYEGIENILRGFEVCKARLAANVNFDLAIELMLLNIKEN